MSPSSTRRRSWPVALPLIVVLALAAVWSGFWFYAVAEGEGLLSAWRQREAQAGRNYACGRQSVGGFPFRFELFCTDASAAFTSNNPAVAFKADKVHAAGQIYDPTLLIAEIGAPLTIAVAGETPVRANWKLLQVSLRGRPPAPERVSMVVDAPALDRPDAGTGEALLRAKRIEMHARVASGTVTNRPVLDLAVSLADVTAPTLHPMMGEPLTVTATGLLRGLDDLRPKPLPVGLRQWQAAGGQLEIKQARIQRGDVTAVAAGSLGLTGDGRLDGQLDVTVAGLEQVLRLLGIEEIAPRNNSLGSALGALDRLIPGLGQVARSRAGAGLAMGLSLIGRPAQLEGRKALALPLRFAGGVVYLGPLRVGEIAPLY